MKWANALSKRSSLEAALTEVSQLASERLNAPADLAILFISSAFTSEFLRVLPLLKELLQVNHLIGCGGNGIIGQPQSGSTQEIEDEPAITLTLAHLPGIGIQTFHVTAKALPDPDSPPQRWIELMGIQPEDDPQFLLMADSASAKINELLQGLDFAYSGSAKIGGLTSGSSMFGGSGLFCDGQMYHEGTVGVALSGNILMDTIVAQGCRPIGPAFLVTEAERHIALEVEKIPTSMVSIPRDLNEQPLMTPLKALESLLAELDDEDRSLAQKALSVGIASNELKQVLEPGDYLIRNLIGVDPKVGAIAIGDRIRAGQRIQFHLRDARASAEDIETLMMRYQSRIAGAENSPQGILLFSCLGRGERFYEEPNFDTGVMSQYVPNVPIAGFFCFGEIGPIGGCTYLHGYTASIGIFRQKNPECSVKHL